jgi:hypothetical protein
MSREELIADLARIVAVAKALTPERVAAINVMVLRRRLYQWRRTIGSSETN